MEALKSLLRFLEGWGIGLGEKLVIISITHSQISSNIEPACFYLLCAPEMVHSHHLHMKQLIPKMFIKRAEVMNVD